MCTHLRPSSRILRPSYVAFRFTWVLARFSCSVFFFFLFFIYSRLYIHEYCAYFSQPYRNYCAKKKLSHKYFNLMRHTLRWFLHFYHFGYKMFVLSRSFGASYVPALRCVSMFGVFQQLFRRSVIYYLFLFRGE